MCWRSELAEDRSIELLTETNSSNLIKANCASLQAILCAGPLVEFNLYFGWFLSELVKIPILSKRLILERDLQIGAQTAAEILGTFQKVSSQLLIAPRK